MIAILFIINVNITQVMLKEKTKNNLVCFKELFLANNLAYKF